MADPPNSGDNGQRSGHLKVITLQTSDDKRSQECITKIEELLGQAKDGSFTEMLILTTKGGSSFSMHWTNIKGQELQFVGALEVIKRILIDSITVNRS